MGNLGSTMITIGLKIQTNSDVRRMFNGFDQATGFFQYIELLIDVVDMDLVGDEATGNGAMNADEGLSN